MVFTSQVFLFIFFPICVLLYFLADRISFVKCFHGFIEKLRIRDVILICLSLGFYMWASVISALGLLAYILIVYMLGLLIQTTKGRGTSAKKHICRRSVALIISVSLVLLCLIFFNYLSFFIDAFSKLFGTSYNAASLIAPIGLSFITFSAISYLADIYRGHATAGSLIDCALFISFFPKVISGPIVLWKDFQGQIKSRRLSLNANVDGLNRIMIGFAKKLILADSFGACLAEISLSGMDWITAFGTMILYMLQLYYDFSGYSDIAIGLAKLFGFEFKENFNFPYRSTSISEFWRRWHISLGTWFKEYVYIPLGGSRKGLIKTLFNLGVVFALTGFWHGARWNYILWGLLNGAFVIIERVIQNKKFYIKTPKPIKYVFTMASVMLFWQLFRYNNLTALKNVGATLLGRVPAERVFYTWQYYFDPQLICLVIIGIAGATLWGSPKVTALYNKVVSTKIGYLLLELTLLLIFVCSIIFMVNSAYSPFIYFQY